MGKGKEVCFVYSREFDGEFYVRVEDFKEIMERVINQRAENGKLVKENKKLKEELSKKSMETWFEKKAENIFIDKSWKVIKGWEFTTLC